MILGLLYSRQRSCRLLSNMCYIIIVIFDPLDSFSGRVSPCLFSLSLVSGFDRLVTPWAWEATRRCTSGYLSNPGNTVTFSIFLKYMSTYTVTFSIFLKYMSTYIVTFSIFLKYMSTYIVTFSIFLKYMSTYIVIF